MKCKIKYFKQIFFEYMEGNTEIAENLGVHFLLYTYCGRFYIFCIGIISVVKIYLVINEEE